MDNRQIFTLKQVVSSIKKTIEDRYHSTYWVKAEMHKLNLYPSGHAFPELVQKEGDKIVAQINGNIWKTQFTQINKRFIEIVKEPLSEGTNLLLCVKIVFNESYGLSLQIIDIDPSYSLGELQKQRDETLKKLSDLGIINNNQNLPFPLLPKRIAVISAESSKGLSDFMHMLEESNNKYTIQTHLFPAYLQGDVAVKSIIQALHKINKVRHHFDVVLIIRGGGGEVGLSCYNHFDLCKSIAEFPLPILTGIGHSTNLTVAEMVSFRHAITPTKLAEFLLVNFKEFDASLQRFSYTLKEKSRNCFSYTKSDFKSAIALLKQLRSKLTLSARNDLSLFSTKISYSSRQLVERSHGKIEQAGANIKRSSKNQLENCDSIFTEYKVRINRVLSQKTTQSYDQLLAFESVINALNPENVLKRGYSITLHKGKLIDQSTKLNVGDLLITRNEHLEIESSWIKSSPTKNDNLNK